MSIACRFITGFSLGLEVNAAPGVYLNLYLGIVEVVFYNEEGLEDE
jgi:hypothetical protein